MSADIKLTRLAECAGCGAKVGAGVLAQLLDGVPHPYRRASFGGLRHQ